jgi:hypothetical protein
MLSKASRAGTTKRLPGEASNGCGEHYQGRGETPRSSEGGLMADPQLPDNSSPAMLRAEARERERLEARYVVYSFLIGLTLGAWVTLLVCRLMW